MYVGTGQTFYIAVRIYFSPYNIFRKDRKYLTNKNSVYKYIYIYIQMYLNTAELCVGWVYNNALLWNTVKSTTLYDIVAYLTLSKFDLIMRKLHW